MHSDQTVHKFRQTYRAAIGRWYNGYLHMAFVALFGISFIGYQISNLNIRWFHALGLAAGLVLWNLMEYAGHRRLGHEKRRIATMFYKRHTGDHHSFFSDTSLVPESHKDWRVTLFPAWLVVVMSLVATVLGLIVTWAFGEEWGTVLSGSLMIGYLAYEFFHFCDHLPSQHFLVKLPWIGHMRQLHRLHHRRDLMHTRNFNVTFPLMDWVMGTFYWSPPIEVNEKRSPR